MILAPIFPAILVCDLIAGLLLAAATLTAMRVLSAWRPGSADSVQLELEIQAETAVIRYRWAFRFFLLATLLLIWAIATVLPAVVPGAMCGTGVLQSMGPGGTAALGLRALTLAAAAAGLEVAHLNAAHPRSPLTPTLSRLVLLTLPAALAAMRETITALLALDPGRPVDCCAVVYSQVSGAGPQVFVLHDSVLIAGWLAASFLVFVGSGWVRRRPDSGAAAWTLAGSVAAWLVLAVAALLQVMTAYHYEVLHHHCPWCLFLPQHHFVGLLLFGMVAIAGIEGLKTLTTSRVGCRYESVRPAARQRVRKTALGAALAAGLFLLVAAAPALWWRLRFGFWMSG